VEAGSITQSRDYINRFAALGNSGTDVYISGLVLGRNKDLSLLHRPISLLFVGTILGVLSLAEKQLGCETGHSPLLPHTSSGPFSFLPLCWPSL
jgi:hypothetical protein